MPYTPPVIPTPIPEVVQIGVKSTSVPLPTLTEHKSNFKKEGIYLVFQCPTDGSTLTIKSIAEDYYLSAFGKLIESFTDLKLVERVINKATVVKVMCDYKVAGTLN
jgi:hypothetical protein